MSTVPPCISGWLESLKRVVGERYYTSSLTPIQVFLGGVGVDLGVWLLLAWHGGAGGSAMLTCEQLAAFDDNVFGGGVSCFWSPWHPEPPKA